MHARVSRAEYVSVLTGLFFVMPWTLRIKGTRLTNWHGGMLLDMEHVCSWLRAVCVLQAIYLYKSVQSYCCLEGSCSTFLYLHIVIKPIAKTQFFSSEQLLHEKSDILFNSFPSLNAATVGFSVSAPNRLTR